jgi:hypothetical protein
MKKQLLFSIGVLAFGATSLNAQVMTPDLTSYGNGAGTATTGGSYFGYEAGQSDVGYDRSRVWNYNTFIGRRTGPRNNTGQLNAFLGDMAGLSNTAGSYNTFLGASAGYRNRIGNGNIFIGYRAGFMLNQSDTFIVDNSPTTTPFLYGTISQKKLGVGGFSAFPSTAGGIDLREFKLFVKGGILTEQLRVSLNTTWADYVFLDNYELCPLNEVESYIKENGHLPNVPSASQIKADGFELGGMTKIQQEKIEELTLYLIAQNKQIEELKTLVKALEEQKAKQ